MALLYLVRHGETAWNAERRWQGQRDLPLTPLGEAQAQAVAERLAPLGLAAVYSSDLLRATQTAGAIAAATGLPVAIDERLREVDVGGWEGLTSDEARERDPDGHARWTAGDTGWTDGETYPAMADRVVAAVEDIAARHDGGAAIAIVGHGGPIRALVAHAVDLPGDGRRQLAPSPNGGISVIDATPSRWTLVRYADSCHVDALVATAAAPESLQPPD